MTVDYNGALAQLIPLIMPDILFRLDGKGQPLFTDFCRGDRADGVPAGEGLWQRGPCSRSITASRWPKAASRRRPISTSAPFSNRKLSNTFRYHLSQYLMRRADDWQAKGFRENAVGLEGAQ